MICPVDEQGECHPAGVRGHDRKGIGISTESALIPTVQLASHAHVDVLEHGKGTMGRSLHRGCMCLCH